MTDVEPGLAPVGGEAAVRPGRPRIPRPREAHREHPTGMRRRRRAADAISLEGRTTTAYALRDDVRRTLGYLRRIVGQSHIPDHATVAIDTDRITIEWED
jgi:hypothetical protein